MSELSFLLDLLLNHKLPKATRDLVAQRIKEVEGNIHAPRPVSSYAQAMPTSPAGPIQAPSTIAAIERHSGATIPAIAMPEVPPQPVAVVAQTVGAINAMNSRQQAINDSLSGKVDKQSGRPRKW